MAGRVAFAEVVSRYVRLFSAFFFVIFAFLVEFGAVTLFVHMVSVFCLPGMVFVQDFGIATFVGQEIGIAVVREGNLNAIYLLGSRFRHAGLHVCCWC